MIVPRIAVATRSLGAPIRQALHIAAEAGAAGVQFDLRTELKESELSDTGLRQLRKLLDDRNLRVATAAFPTRRGYADPEDLERRVQATIDAMKLASKLAARTMVVTLGQVPEEEDRQRAVLIDALASLAAQGDRLGVRLALACCDSPVGAVERLLASAPAGAIGVDLNPADIIRHGQRPRDWVATLGSHVVHVYATDAVRSGGSAVDVQLGRGTADFPELLGALEEHDYRDWITIDVRNSSTAPQDAADAVQFLRSM